MQSAGLWLSMSQCNLLLAVPRAGACAAATWRHVAVRAAAARASFAWRAHCEPALRSCALACLLIDRARSGSNSHFCLVFITNDCAFEPHRALLIAGWSWIKEVTRSNPVPVTRFLLFLLSVRWMTETVTLLLQIQEFCQAAQACCGRVLRAVRRVRGLGLEA